MKLLYFFTCLLLTFLTVAQPGDSDQLFTEGLKLSETAKGTITYEVTSGGAGRVIHAFDRNSLLSSTTTQIDYTLYGIETKMNEVDIRDGSYRYIYDLTKNSGRRKQVKTEIDLLKYKSMEETRTAMFEINGGTLVGAETILGKETERWKFTSGPIKEAWYWDGILLKAEIKRPKITYSYEATEINFDVVEISFPDIDISGN